MPNIRSDSDVLDKLALYIDIIKEAILPKELIKVPCQSLHQVLRHLPGHPAHDPEYFSASDCVDLCILSSLSRRASASVGKFQTSPLRLIWMDLPCSCRLVNGVVEASSSVT